jgi:hypothetical protein
MINQPGNEQLREEKHCAFAICPRGCIRTGHLCAGINSLGLRVVHGWNVGCVLGKSLALQEIVIFWVALGSTTELIHLTDNVDLCSFHTYDSELTLRNHTLELPSLLIDFCFNRDINKARGNENQPIAWMRFCYISHSSSSLSRQVRRRWRFEACPNPHQANTKAIFNPKSVSWWTQFP